MIVNPHLEENILVLLVCLGLDLLGQFEDRLELGVVGVFLSGVSFHSLMFCLHMFGTSQSPRLVVCSGLHTRFDTVQTRRNPVRAH